VNETQVTMLGNAVEDPVLRFGKSGQPFVTFRLASTVRRRDPATGLFVDAGTNFVTVLAFRQLARNVAESVRKGQPVVVSGRLRVNQWSSGERTGTSVEIDAATVGHDLTRGVGRFTKVRGGTFGEGSFPADVPGDSLSGMAEFIYTMTKARKAVGDKLILDDVTMAFFPARRSAWSAPTGRASRRSSRSWRGWTSPATVRRG
jgi:single stranded DNA-binding protein